MKRKYPELFANSGKKFKFQGWNFLWRDEKGGQFI